MKICVCEPDKPTAEQILSHITEYFEHTTIPCKTDIFHNSEDILTTENHYDLIFLDYELSQYEKAQITDKLTKSNKKSVMIFITDYNEDAFQSFEAGAYHYLLKPINQAKFIKILNDYTSFTEQNAVVEVPIKRKNLIISLSDIMYIESEGKYSVVRLVDSQIETAKSLTAFQNEITNRAFFRTHRMFLVNMKYITEINGNRLIMSNGELVTISRRNLANFNKCYTSYLKSPLETVNI